MIFNLFNAFSKVKAKLLDISRKLRIAYGIGKDIYRYISPVKLQPGDSVLYEVKIDLKQERT